MSRGLICVLLLATLLLALGCDRFKHNFQPPDELDFAAELFTPLQTAFNAVGTNGLDPVMAYYAEDYLHFGLLKADRRSWLQGLFNTHPDAQATVTLLDAETLTDSTAIANWRLVLATPAKQTEIADSVFTGERLIERGGHWLLKGNQMVCEPPTPKQRVIIEYFTFLGCPNCPPVEAELHDLQITYPDQLSYLEYHVSGPLTLTGDPTYSYYGPFTVPTSVFQGETRLIGSGTEILDSYAPLAQNLAAADSKFRYNNLTFSLDGQTVSGSLELELLEQSLDLADLVLNIAIIERVSSYNNTQGEPLRNVVRAKMFQDVTASALDQPILFSLTSPTPIPDDASLVIFAQTRPSVFANNATIHGGIELPLFATSTAKRK